MITAKSCVRRISASIEDIKTDYISKGDYAGAAEGWNNALEEANYRSLKPKIKNLPCGWLFTVTVDGINGQLQKGADGNIEPDYNLLKESAERTQQKVRVRRTYID